MTTDAPEAAVPTDAAEAPAVPEQELAAAAQSGDAHWQKKMQRLRDRKLPQRSIRILLDDEPQEALDVASNELFDAQMRKDRDPSVTDEQIADLQAKVEAAEQAVKDASEELTFRGLPRPIYEKLMAEHKPTEEQEKDGEVYNVDTFAPALIAACSVDGMPLEDAKALMAEWNQGEGGAMFSLCTTLNQTVRLHLVDVGKGSR